LDAEFSEMRDPSLPPESEGWRRLCVLTKDHASMSANAGAALRFWKAAIGTHHRAFDDARRFTQPNALEDVIQIGREKNP